MDDLKQLQKKEALEQLKILQSEFGLKDTVIKEFEQKDTVYYSEDIAPNYSGILYWISNKEEYVNAIKKFEEKHNALVYHAILNYTIFGTILTLLYVSEDQSVWEEDRENLQDGLPLVYCVNLEDDNCSEFGGIQIEGKNGGIIRVA